MMKKYFLFPFLAFIAFSPAISQEMNDEERGKIKISEFHITTGVVFNQIMNSSLEDYRTLDPQSELLKHDFSDYNQYNYEFGGFMFGMMLGMQLKDQKEKGSYKTNPLLRAGFSFHSSIPFTSQFNKETTTPYDTLVSNQTGEVYYVDSVNTEFYNMEYQNEQIRLDLSILFRTNTASTWSLFAGVGLNAGVSIQSQTRVSKHGFGNEQIRYRNGKSTYTNYYDHSPTEQTINNNKTNFGASLYVPLGVNFKLSKKKEFWSKIHLRYEMRPAINITTIPELSTKTYTSIQHGLGFKVAW